jgi:Holliday junction resolvase
MSFKDFENKGRKEATELLENLGFSEICPSADLMSNYDLTAGKGKTAYIIEVKKRQSNMDKYPDYLIEKNKYNSLMSYSEIGFKPLYINLFDDGAIIFNISEHKDLMEKKIECPATTVDEKYKYEKICYLLRVLDTDFVVNYN